MDGEEVGVVIPRNNNNTFFDFNRPTTDRFIPAVNTLTSMTMRKVGTY
jgi:hypothetical protein